jgi:antitoxin HigA-1
VETKLKTPGDLLRELINEKGLSVQAAAEKLGVAKSLLFTIFKGSARITPNMAVRIERDLGSNAELLISYQSMFDIMKARAEVAATKKESAHV